MFATLAAKLLGIHLAASYYYQGNRSVVMVHGPKLQKYPLFLNKHFGLNLTKMGLLFLHADLLRVAKALCARSGGVSGTFKDFVDLIALVRTLGQRYLVRSDY